MTVRESAILYVGLKWPTIPLWWPLGLDTCACPEGAACGSPGKHPHGRLAPRGLKDATIDPDVIRTWWEAVPNLNVGLVTGVAFDVLDIDNPEAGRWLAQYAHDHGAVTPDCWEWGPLSLTGHGEHLLYAPTGSGNRSRVAKVTGFDWRARDGYIVAPPSRHHTGAQYRWHEHCGPDVPIPVAPSFLIDLVTGRSDLVASVPTLTSLTAGRMSSVNGWSPSGLIARVATASNGERNAMLYWAAKRVGLDVRARRVAGTDATSALEDIATAAERSGLNSHEVELTVESGYLKGLAGGDKGDRP